MQLNGSSIAPTGCCARDSESEKVREGATSPHTQEASSFASVWFICSPTIHKSSLHAAQAHTSAMARMPRHRVSLEGLPPPGEGAWAGDRERKERMKGKGEGGAHRHSDPTVRVEACEAHPLAGPTGPRKREGRGDCRV